MANKKLKTIQFPGLPDTYTVPQVENGANNNVAALDGAGNVKDSAIEVSKVAKTDGSYQSLNAGTSDQLNATVGVTDKVPYNFRTVGGSADIGNRLNDKIVGGTIAWNQLINPANKSPTIEFDSATGLFSMENYVTEDSRYIDDSIELTKDHKYLLYFSDYIRYSILYVRGGSFTKGFAGSAVAQAQVQTIFNVPDNVTVSIYFNRYQASASNPSYYNGYIQFFDLTQMFGSTIADYIYSLEQATAGAGVEWFKNLFPKPYYEYNAGELMSVCTNEHITRGFNAYNHANGTAKLVGGKQYQITGAYTSLAYSTGETISLNESGLFTPTENGVLTVTGGNATDTCVHLVWSGYRNGEYEPYVEHRYPLSPIKLRGIPKLDVSNNLYFDGDTYEKDGTVTRRYEYRDYEEGDDSLPNTITDGIHTVTPLATPTVETANKFADPQIVDDFGTEEYVDALATAETSPRDVAIPVGHETFYQANLRDKLQNLPANASADGLYLIKQTGNKQELIAYTPESELPTSPAETGTYVLKLVDGTLTWVLEG